jgi:predicted metal-binding membrane protein
MIRKIFFGLVCASSIVALVTKNLLFLIPAAASIILGIVFVVAMLLPGAKPILFEIKQVTKVWKLLFLLIPTVIFYVINRLFGTDLIQSLSAVTILVFLHFWFVGNYYISVRWKPLPKTLTEHIDRMR